MESVIFLQPLDLKTV